MLFLLDSYFAGTRLLQSCADRQQIKELLVLLVVDELLLDLADLALELIMGFVELVLAPGLDLIGLLLLPVRVLSQLRLC